MSAQLDLFARSRPAAPPARPSRAAKASVVCPVLSAFAYAAAQETDPAWPTIVSLVLRAQPDETRAERLVADAVEAARFACLAAGSPEADDLVASSAPGDAWVAPGEAMRTPLLRAESLLGGINATENLPYVLAHLDLVAARDALSVDAADDAERDAFEACIAAAGARRAARHWLLTSAALACSCANEARRWVTHWRTHGGDPFWRYDERAAQQAGAAFMFAGVAARAETTALLRGLLNREAGE